MFFFYNVMMSGRLFHSADLDGLNEALTDENTHQRQPSRR